MTLTGSREDWQEMLQRNNEGWRLKDEHVACIARALAVSSPDAEYIEVDAKLTALKQTSERLGPAEKERNPVRQIANSIADSDESWWIHRARTLGLMTIVPVEPWPRFPEMFFRPPMYLHNFGPDNKFPDPPLDEDGNDESIFGGG